MILILLSKKFLRWSQYENKRGYAERVETSHNNDTLFIDFLAT